LIGHLVVEDMAPKRARMSADFEAYVAGMNSILERGCTSRKEAGGCLAEKLLR
jgi:hypothetical protein